MTFQYGPNPILGLSTRIYEFTTVLNLQTPLPNLLIGHVYFGNLVDLQQHRLLARIDPICFLGRAVNPRHLRGIADVRIVSYLSFLPFCTTQATVFLSSMSNPICWSIMEPPEKGFCGVTHDHVYLGRYYYNDPVSNPGGSGFIVSPASLEAVDTTYFTTFLGREPYSLTGPEDRSLLATSASAEASG